MSCFHTHQRPAELSRAKRLFSRTVPMTRLRIAVVAALLTIKPAAFAITFDFTLFDETVEAVSNTTLIAGVAMRVEGKDERLIAKGNVDPDVCGRTADGKTFYQDCQGVFRTQSFVADKLAGAPGFASNNFDQANNNYGRWDLTQAPLRLGQDITLSWGDFGFFARALAYYDPVNHHFTETFPNRVDRNNALNVGYVSRPGDETIRTGTLDANTLSALGPLVAGLGLDDNLVGQLLGNPVGIPVLGVRSDSMPCPAARNPGGGPCGIVYGRGGRVKAKRRDDETLKQIGLAFQLQEVSLYGTLPIGEDRELSFRLGRQLVSWGESTILFFDSLNVANPANLNNLFRVGGNGLDDFYQPVNMISFGTSLFESASVSAFYQLEWQPLETPAPGGLYSVANIGVNGAGSDYAMLGFGQLADDPDNVGFLLDNPLSAITNGGARAQRLPDREPGAAGQFGIQLKYYAEWLNNGTEFGLYFAQYHSRSPFISFFSADRSCAKDATDTATFLASCPDTPLAHALLNPNDPAGATSDALGLDSVKLRVEYPEEIQMYGFSMNTTLGDFALQGEVAYRPDEPLQVALVDLAFASLGPSLTNCHLAPGCIGTTTGLGTQPDGSIGAYGSSDYVLDAQGTRGAYADSFDLLIGHLPGSGRAFPSFVIPYRGGVLGQNPANSRIRGWEEFETFSFNIGGTYVEGNTDLFPPLIGADQIIWIFEVGARWVPDLPSLDELQLEGPGIEYHASAGADGSGADRSRQACSSNAACSFGPDGLRFNPHQQNRDLYPTEWSGGYSVVALIRYESVLPGISLQPQIIFKHDLYGHSPGLASNFIEDRILWDTGFEVRYKSNLSFNLGYQLFAGGGVAHTMSDKDNARLFIKYSF